MHFFIWVSMKSTLFLLCTSLIKDSKSSISGRMAGDANPPAYSVINLDLDTIERPPSVDKSIMSYVNAVDGMHASMFLHLFLHFRHTPDDS